MVVIFISCEEVFSHVMTWNIDLNIGNIDWKSQDLVWRVLGSAAWMWSIAEHVGEKYRSWWVQWLCRAGGWWGGMNIDDLTCTIAWKKPCAVLKALLKHWLLALGTDLLCKEMLLLSSQFSGWTLLSGQFRWQCGRSGYRRWLPSTLPSAVKPDSGTICQFFSIAQRHFQRGWGK